MTDKKIIDLVALVAQQVGDLYEVSDPTGLLPSNKETRQQMLNFMKQNITLQTSFDSGDGSVTAAPLKDFVLKDSVLTNIFQAGDTGVIAKSIYGVQTFRPTLTQEANTNITSAKIGNVLTNGSSNSYAYTLTSGDGLPVGSEFEILNLSTGDVTLQAAGGVSLNGIVAGSQIINEDFERVICRKISASAWASYVLSQNLVAGGVLQIYVDSFAGVDEIGRGSAIAPFKTISFANSQIVGASQSKPYLINAIGDFTDVSWTIKPFVYYQFNQSSYTVTNPVTLDPSWSAGGEVYINGISNFVGNMSLNFNSINSPFAICSLSNIASSGQIQIIANSIGITVAFLENIRGNTSTPDVTLTNCYGAANNLNTQTFIQTHTSETAGNRFEINNLTTVDFIVQDSTTAGLQVITSDVKVLSTANFISNGLGDLTFSTTGNVYVGGLTIDGANTFLFADVLLNAPTFLNGADASNISLSARYAVSAGAGLSYNPLTGVFEADAIPAVVEQAYGEFFIQGNTTPTILSVGVPEKVDLAFTAGNLNNFSYANGRLIFTGVDPTILDVCVSMTAVPQNSASISMMVFKNGAIVTKSQQTINLSGVTPSPKAMSSGTTSTFNTNDYIELFIQNDSNSDPVTVVDVNTFRANSIGGVGSAPQTITQQSAYDGGNTILQTASTPMFYESNNLTIIPTHSFRQLAIPAIGNIVGQTTYESLNAIGNPTTYGKVDCQVFSSTNTQERSRVRYYALVNGVQTILMELRGDGGSGGYVLANNLDATGYLAQSNGGVGFNTTILSSGAFTVSMPTINGNTYGMRINYNDPVFPVDFDAFATVMGKGVNFTLGTSTQATTGYVSAFQSVWTTLNGTNIVTAKTLRVGQTVEVDITGIVNKVDNGANIDS